MKRSAPANVLLDLNCPVQSEEGRRLPALSASLGAVLVQRKGRYWLQLGADQLQPYDQLPANPWLGGNVDAAQRCMEQMEETGAVMGLQDLLLMACPGAAAAAERAALAKPLLAVPWDPKEVHQWVDAQLTEHEGGDQAQPALLEGGVLAPYQLSGLRFMLDRESTDFRDDMWAEVQAADGRRLWYSPSFGRLSPAEPPSGTCGGILADYMGLGKTVMALSLVAATLEEQESPTLVVCPSTLVQQWKREAARWLPGVDCVVVTSTRTLASQLDGHRGLALAAYSTLRRINVAGAQLHRVVFDEAHTMGSARPPSPSTPATHTATVKVCASIDAPRRWALTGTPVTTRHSVHSMLTALRVGTFSDWEFSRSMVLCTVGSASYFGAQLAACMLRRTEAVLDAQLGIGVVRHPAQQVQLSEAEQRVYTAARSLGSTVHAQGTGMALRRLAAGASVDEAVLSSGAWLQLTEAGWQHDTPAAAAPIVDPAIASEQRCAEACAICLSEPMRAPQAATACKHCFCGQCLLTWLRAAGARARCPMCRQPVRLRDVRIAAPLQFAAEEGEVSRDSAAVLAAAKQRLSAAVATLPRDPEVEGHVLLSSKPEAIAAKVREILEDDDGGAAVLVFSHFADTLHLIGRQVQRDDVASLLCPPPQRQAEVDRFQRGETRVLLLPYASRMSSGLNLTAANHIVLAERAVNPGEEEQAIGRARRIGQQRQVHVWQFEAPGTCDVPFSF